MTFSKKHLNPLSIAQILLFFWVFSLFFPIKFVFPSHFSYETGLFSDFTSISLYLSDILLFITWFWVVIPRGREFYHVIVRKNPIKWLILWVFVVFLLNFNENWPLSLFFLGKTLELIVAYGTIAVIFHETSIKTRFLSLFTALCGIQSLIALNQFYLQHPVGLFNLGEQQVYPWQWGIAKLVSYGTPYIRGYGTFPHPNLLAAFLVAGILINIYLFLKATKLHWQAVLGGLLIITILGLTATFSRAGYLALGLGLVVFLALNYFWRHSETRVHQSEEESRSFRSAIIVIFIVIVSFGISFGFFHRFLLTRATISDQATIERGVYNHIALKMIKDKPIFGQGIGQSVLHMQQYSDFKLTPWQIQPIHNYFLLTAGELGIPGALILIGIFVWHWFRIWNLNIWRLFRNWKLEIRNLQLNFYSLTLATILLCFVTLMMFDHYFYTLQQTQFLLWVVLGLIAAEA